MAERAGRPHHSRSGGRQFGGALHVHALVLVTIRPTVRNWLKAMASVENRLAWQIVEDAVEFYFAQCPAENRRAIQLAARRASVM